MQSVAVKAVKEEVLQFGEGRSLVGVLSTCSGTPSDPELPAVIILNAGFLHRVGPNRLHVKIARCLALAGFRTLRFDFSGLGDSEARRDSLPYEQSTLREVTNAMNLLSDTRGVRRFVLMGICSGADNAFRVACQDDRVVGAVLINGFTRFTFHYYLSQLVSMSQWKRVLFGKRTVKATFDRVGTLARSLTSLPSGTERTWQIPPPEKILTGLDLLVGRGVRLWFIYTRKSSVTYYGYMLVDRYIADSSSRLNFHLEGFESADHTFTPLDQQAILIRRIADWMKGTKWVSTHILLALLGSPLTDFLAGFSLIQ